jgi:plastocyanin
MQRDTCVSVLRTSMRMAVLGLAVAGLAGAVVVENKPSSPLITIDNFSFGPAIVTVAAGTEVTWVNRDDIPHMIVSEDRSTFKSAALDTDDKFSFTFAKPGTYTYFCSIHPKMTAKVVVQ